MFGRWLGGFVVGLLLLGGLVGLVFPFASGWWWAWVERGVVGDYVEEVDVCGGCDEVLEGAKLLNSSGDVYGLSWEEYFGVLSVPGGSGDLLGVVSVPSVDVVLPVFYGTSVEVLDRGVGHVFGSGLPVGGEGVHSVLTAHSGLPERRMFDALVGVEVGDVFGVEVLGEVFSYRVVGVDVVEPELFGSVTAPVAGRDLLSLATCTPYSVNSHRLVVTGERVFVDDDLGLGEVVGFDLKGLLVWLVPFLVGVGLVVWLVVRVVRR